MSKKLLRNKDQRERYGVESTRWLEQMRRKKKLPPPEYPFGTFPANTEEELDAWDAMSDAEREEYLSTPLLVERLEIAREKQKKRLRAFSSGAINQTETTT